jgi:hypothetical protein
MNEEAFDLAGDRMASLAEDQWEAEQRGETFVLPIYKNTNKKVKNGNFETD